MLLLGEHEVNGPAAADVRSRSALVAYNGVSRYRCRQIYSPGGARRPRPAFDADPSRYSRADRCGGPPRCVEAFVPVHLPTAPTACVPMPSPDSSHQSGAVLIYKHHVNLAADRPLLLGYRLYLMLDAIQYKAPH
jgi:hypothetical protein